MRVQHDLAAAAQLAQDRSVQHPALDLLEVQLERVGPDVGSRRRGTRSSGRRITSRCFIGRKRRSGPSVNASELGDQAAAEPLFERRDRSRLLVGVEAGATKSESSTPRSAEASACSRSGDRSSPRVACRGSRRHASRRRCGHGRGRSRQRRAGPRRTPPKQGPALPRQRSLDRVDQLGCRAGLAVGAVGLGRTDRDSREPAGSPRSETLRASPCACSAGANRERLRAERRRCPVRSRRSCTSRAGGSRPPHCALRDASNQRELSRNSSRSQNRRLRKRMYASNSSSRSASAPSATWGPQSAESHASGRGRRGCRHRSHWETFAPLRRASRNRGRRPSVR